MSRFRLQSCLFWVGLLILAAGAVGCGKTTSPSPAKVAGVASGQTQAPQVDGPVRTFAVDQEIETPFILWGGDVATFHANGGLNTRPNTIFHQHGLKVKLVPGDDFDKQVKNYLEGKSPLLRGTMSMLGQVSEQIGKERNSQPVVFLQLTWSAGDHLVSRAGLKMLSDLKGKTVALQKGGPHVGMLNDILRTANLTWSDVTVKWTDDVSGDKGPAALFSKDASVDACFAITPDMTDLTGGLDKTGDGKGKSVSGAHVLVSTAHMSRSIADVYACRKDFFDAHRDWVEKFAAGYLKAAEELMAMKKTFQDKKDAPAYKAILKLTRDIYGKDAGTKDALKSDDDADGLISDAAFVGLPGNFSFFQTPGNLSGFKPKMRAALDLALALGDAKERYELLDAKWDYNHVKELGKLIGKPLPAERFRDDVKFLTEDTIYYFTVSFEPNQSVFPEAQYGQAFQRALEQASLFGKAVMVVRGHTDAADVLEKFKQTGLRNGKLKQGKGEYDFILNDGTTLDLRDAKKVVELIKKDNFGNPELSDGIAFFQKLSEERAERVRGALVSYAQNKGYDMDRSQVRPSGAGMTEPVVALPRYDAPQDWTKNRRVEFRIIRVSGGEATQSEGFDY
jgi:ABC-type nitrate/sulfonate/bicarbonate transport system substrate-binding protein